MRDLRNIALILCLAASLVGRSEGQETPSSPGAFSTASYSAPLQQLIDSPTAGTLPQQNYAFDIRLYPNGGILFGVGIGLLSRLMVEVYYGGENIIGEGEINWNPLIGLDVRLRVIDESLVFPGIAVGFSSQGLEGYHDPIDRYRLKSKGLYIVASRNYNMLGNLGLHGGVNRSFEDDDGDEDLNFFIGLDKQLIGSLEFIVDYDFALNDNETETFGQNNGYFNMGLRWTIAQQLHVELDVRNISENRPGSSQIGRGIKFTYEHTIR